MNRNRILNPEGGFIYINASIHKATVGTNTKDIKLNNKEEWKKKILAQMEVYKKIAPYYNEVVTFIKKSFLYKTDSLSEMNTYLLMKVCEYLGIEYDIDVLSNMNLKLGEVLAPDEWGLNISKAMGAREYLNAPGGIDFFNKEKYSISGIELKFIKPNLKPYIQRIDGFEPGLSILDLMMFNSVEEINNMLDDYEVL